MATFVRNFKDLQIIISKTFRHFFFFFSLSVFKFVLFISLFVSTETSFFFLGVVLQPFLPFITVKRNNWYGNNVSDESHHNML